MSLNTEYLFNTSQNTANNYDITNMSDKAWLQKYVRIWDEHQYHSVLTCTGFLTEI
jgi:hypothetical protein